MVLPGSNKNFDQFRYDDAQCQHYAKSLTVPSPAEAASTAGVSSAVLGTALGAVAGAAIGGNQGAAVGAGTGLLVGGLSGTEAANASAHGSQRQYDNAYIQCMYAQGHRVPVYGRFQQSSTPPDGRYFHQNATTSPYTDNVPPPPIGMPPPPPPDAR